MVVSGACRSSTIHVRLAGGSSIRSKPLVAWTSKVCSPYGVPEAEARSAAVSECGEEQGVNSAPSSEQA
jgi:hypothetical protein